MHLERASAAVKDTFAALQDALAAIGPHSIVAVKTMILLRAASNFGNVIVRRERLDLEFVLPRVASDRRFHKVQRLGPHKHTHHLRLSSPKEVDADVKAWLREAYQIGAASVPR